MGNFKRELKIEVHFYTLQKKGNFNLHSKFTCAPSKKLDLFYCSPKRLSTHFLIGNSKNFIAVIFFYRIFKATFQYWRKVSVNNMYLEKREVIIITKKP